jgi:hypothetical protein
LKNKKQIIDVELNGEKLTIVAVSIPELNWHILELLK